MTEPHVIDKQLYLKTLAILAQPIILLGIKEQLLTRIVCHAKV